ncbi:translation machinery-associated protein 20 [Alternaria rosae]|uniref:translation machinery-associated protein 20 n=1 Tax=Alternaria rosae TaxID=1187941 RepID=UPI001E8D337A|nr:translation machinery-associated protein 20 [Alternaria rosae]KAH6861084.1 translation machinery-associated protein 20 [Alternaria rosae]
MRGNRGAPIYAAAVSTPNTVAYKPNSPHTTDTMFKKDITSGAKSKVKSSAQRAIRSKVLEEYPRLEPYIEDILPKKEQLDLVKLPDRVSLYTLHSTPLFFQHMDDALLPHLTLVHKYPFAFHRLRIDRGAIRFVLSGATLMAPGLTSPGGRLPGPELSDDDKEVYGAEDLKEGEVVVIEAEGKETACMVGVLKMGTEEMKKVKKGQACEAGHYLGDGLWGLKLD